jgi:hypothetical protein
MLTSLVRTHISLIRTDRRSLASVALAAGFVAVAGRAVVTAQKATPGAGKATAQIMAAANAFLNTMSDPEREAVLFDRTDPAQKQRWTNLAEGLFERDGLMWTHLDQESRDAWLALMQATLRTEGYNRFIAEWNADDALATDEGAAQWRAARIARRNAAGRRPRRRSAGDWRSRRRPVALRD